MYVQSDTLLLSDVFKNCLNMCLKIYKIDPTRFLGAPGLAWQAALKKTLMVEKGISRGICHSMYRYAKANIKYMKDYNKNKES